jgi:PAS domain-containing protein
LTEAERLTLQDLAAIVIEQFEMRIASRKTLDDVQARLFVEEKLAVKEQQLALLIEHAPAAIAMFDRDMRYLAASRRWRTDFRLGEQVLDHRSHYEVSPTICDRWREDHRRCLEGEVLSDENDSFAQSIGCAGNCALGETRPARSAASSFSTR